MQEQRSSLPPRETAVFLFRLRKKSFIQHLFTVNRFSMPRYEDKKRLGRRMDIKNIRIGCLFSYVIIYVAENSDRGCLSEPRFWKIEFSFLLRSAVVLFSSATRPRRFLGRWFQLFSAYIYRSALGCPLSSVFIPPSLGRAVQTTRYSVRPLFLFIFQTNPPSPASILYSAVLPVRVGCDFRP